MSDPAQRSDWRHKLGAFLRIANVRLRFVLLMIVTGLIAAKWDVVAARWDRWRHPVHVAMEQAAAVEYYCPMHPDVVRDAPGNCPICGMPLSKRERTAAAATLPEGVVGRVELSPERLSLAGVATSAVERRALGRRVQAAGAVEVDERNVAKISSRVAGRIESLQVDATGLTVTRGQSLAEIYSPDLMTTEREYLLAKSATGPSRPSHFSHGVRTPVTGDPILESARARLTLWGMGEDQIAALERAGEPTLRLAIRAPIGGTVLEKNVVVGQYVEEGAPLYTVADLSSVWVTLSIPENDMQGVGVGRVVTITSDALPGRRLTGRVSFVWPNVDRDTRTLRARLDVPNPDGVLVPGMYVDAAIDVSGGSISALAVPESAVIDTGTRQVVYVERGSGVYEATEVKVGPLADGWYPVLSGLSEGDTVVTQGTFLVDAELRLHPGAAGSYFGASGSPSQQQGMSPGMTSHAGHAH